MEDLHVLLKETISANPLCDEPESKRSSKTIELSGLDRISPAMLYTVFFYKSNPGSESIASTADNNIERAKRALRRVLISWFPAAGRLGINQETGKLEIDCNNEGVAVITAETRSKLEELGELHEYKPCYETLVPNLPDSGNISNNIPLVVVQITKFSCGGISIGLGGNHALFDGFGAFNFLADWAYISSEKDGLISRHDHELTIPNHSRERLLQSVKLIPGSSSSSSSTSTSTSSVTASISATSSIYEQDHIAAIQDLYGVPMQGMASDDRCWESELAKFGGTERQGLRLVTLCMKKETVEIWKGLVVQSGKLSKCSTFDVLCAHVWKARVKALSLEPNTNICLQFPVDSRSRLQPPLGPNFTGNAFVLASVSCAAKDLIEEPLRSTIAKIQAAKDVVTDEYIKLYVRALECSSDKFFPSMRELTIITDWLKFPFKALDFGWGKACSASILRTPVPEAAFVMPNLEEPGNFLVRMGIGEQYVRDLLCNFNAFNHPI